MKLAEAAQVLGISLEDVTLPGLKNRFANLTMSFDPEKVSYASFIVAA